MVMDTLSGAAATLYAAMAHTGTVLPAFLLNDDNQATERHTLSLIAGLTGLAQLEPSDRLTPGQIYDALDTAYGLEKSCIFSFAELLELLSHTYEAAVHPPFPPLSIPHADRDTPETVAELYGIDLAAFSGKLSGRQRYVWDGLLIDTLGLAQARYPWRIGTTRADHAEPFVPGPPPEEPSI